MCSLDLTLVDGVGFQRRIPHGAVHRNLAEVDFVLFPSAKDLLVWAKTCQFGDFPDSAFEA